MLKPFKKLINIQVSNRVLALIAILVFTLTIALVWTDAKQALPELPDLLSWLRRPKPAPINTNIQRFASEGDFKEYLQKSLGFNYGASALFNETMALNEMAMPVPDLSAKGSGQPERISETNIQVAGIDEPDIIKTDGKEIYFSNENWLGRPIPMFEPGISFEEQKMIAPEHWAKTSLFKAFPPESLALDSEIKKSGKLLLTNNILLIFASQEIYGYDVSDPKNPEQKWTLKLDDRAFLATSRLSQGKVYLITQTNINQIKPCPFKVLGEDEIACAEIYRPDIITPIDSTFTAMVLNPVSGQVEQRISFVGSSSDSVVYMSPEAIFITYSYQQDMASFFISFLKEKARNLYPALIFSKLDKLAGYDISQQSKLTESQLIIASYQNSLDDNERLKLENELTNRMDDYLTEHLRDIDKTGLIKIGLSDFQISASGAVAGHPLNQFSLDEDNGYLRIATTVGQRWWGWGFSASIQSLNDVYVLDQNLKQVGAIQDLGLSERIYAARFVGDKGYLVTFKETDPFYVLDLSNPRNPRMAGELKIPGYSSYLEPISDNRVLGIGIEDWQVKISLFDVSVAANPKEIAKYVLQEGWSEVLSNHHAFLLDAKHQIFFIPGSQGSYILSYQNNRLELKKALKSDAAVRRAIYLDDYLYIVSDAKITVLNETDWTVVKEFTF